MIIQFFNFNLKRVGKRSMISCVKIYLPSDFVSFGVVFQSDRKISSFVEFTERRRFAVSNSRRFGWRRRVHLNERAAILDRKIRRTTRLTLAFLSNDFTVNPSVASVPAGRSRRGELARAMKFLFAGEFARLLQISHKCQRHSLSFLFVDDDDDNHWRNETIAKRPSSSHHLATLTHRQLTTTSFFTRDKNLLRKKKIKRYCYPVKSHASHDYWISCITNLLSSEYENWATMEADVHRIQWGISKARANEKRRENCSFRNV